MEAHRKSCFEALRHKNACSIDELKSRLRKLYVQDLKVKRDKILKDKRDIVISEEDEVDFYKRYCREFFGRHEDPVDVDDALLHQIWEEIRLEEIEKAEANLFESLVDHSSGDQIVCPVCLKLPAQLDTSHCLTCSCGLKFPLPNHIDLKDFEATLLTGNDIHSETCKFTPMYRVRPTSENSLQFTSSCESCLYFNIFLETPI
ncbi:RPA-interacting protein B-like [Daphnia pulex]|uniref:RPA-interacting protein B-like n=1 Tax=Daphnia pulex TaxID=6669 RepID=UPI001EE1213A|nr:RPA-interacting protein B-like [Daphnia pulex]